MIIRPEDFCEMRNWWKLEPEPQKLENSFWEDILMIYFLNKGTVRLNRRMIFSIVLMELFVLVGDQVPFSFHSSTDCVPKHQCRRFGFYLVGFTCTKPQQGSTHPMKQSRKLIWSVYITCTSCVYTCIFIIRYIISRISPLRTWPRNWWSWRILVRILPTAAFRKHGNIELKQHTASPIQFMI